jgi:hypothetical protein
MVPVNFRVGSISKMMAPSGSGKVGVGVRVGVAGGVGRTVTQPADRKSKGRKKLI